ncbi:MAG: hypothetical protein WCL03_09220 [Bacteroidota bacterium]
MKTILKSLAAVLLITGALLLSNHAIADPPPPPPPPGDHGSGGNQPPVGAPIDGGLGILLAMGAAYGAKKFYKARKDKNKEEEPAVEI